MSIEDGSDGSSADGSADGSADTDRRDDFDHEQARQALEMVPDRPLTSLYDVVLLYAAAEQYETLTAPAFPDSAGVDAALAMTPDSSDFFGQDNSIVAARVDLSGPEPRLGDPPVSYRTLTDEDRFRIGYMARDKTARATDYSITNSTSTSGAETVEKIAHDEWADRFTTGRFTRFPNRDTVQELIDDAVEGHELLETLQELGNDESFLSDLQDAVVEQTTADETQALVTVQFKLSADGDYKYPGEIPILNQAGVKARQQHLIDGVSIESSGEGVGYVTDETSDVLGATSGVNDQYSKKKVTRFQNLDESLAWTNRPVSVDVADAIDAGDEALDQFYVGRGGLRFYYLPYPTGTVDLETFQEFVEDVFRPLSRAVDTEDSDEGTSEYYVTRLLQILVGSDAITKRSIDELLPDGPDDELDSVRADAAAAAEAAAADGDLDLGGEVSDADTHPMSLYAIVHNAASDPSRTFAEDSNAALDIVGDLNQTYTAVRKWLETHPLFGDAPTHTFVFPHTESGSYPIARQVLNGYLFDDLTAASRDPDSGRPDQRSRTLESPEFVRDWHLLSGQPLSRRDLLTAYARKLQQVERKQQDNSDAFGPVPYVIAQYEQLRVLEACGSLDTTVLDTRDTTMTDTEYDSQAARLEAFIDEHGLLDENRAERAAFALGGLVARLTALQQSEQLDRSRTTTQQYPVDRLTATTFEEVAEGVLGKNQEYADVLDVTSQGLNAHYVEILKETLLDEPPTEWSVSDSRLRWVYALGMAYGKGDSSGDFRDEDEKEDEGEVDQEPTA